MQAASESFGGMWGTVQSIYDSDINHGGSADDHSTKRITCRRKRRRDKRTHVRSTSSRGRRLETRSVVRLKLGFICRLPVQRTPSIRFKNIRMMPISLSIRLTAVTKQRTILSPPADARLKAVAYQVHHSACYIYVLHTEHILAPILKGRGQRHAEKMGQPRR